MDILFNFAKLSIFCWFNWKTDHQTQRTMLVMIWFPYSHSHKTVNTPVTYKILFLSLTLFHHLHFKVHSASQSTSLTHSQAGGCWAEDCASCGWSWTTCFAQRPSSTSSSLVTTASCPLHVRWVAAFLLPSFLVREKNWLRSFEVPPFFLLLPYKCKVLEVCGFTPGRWVSRSLVGGSVASSSQMCPSAKVNHHWPLQAQSHP